jgi:hypothetical protein
MKKPGQAAGRRRPTNMNTLDTSGVIGHKHDLFSEKNVLLHDPLLSALKNAC